ncbi:hypothetical protein K4B79_15875 [Streptomyces lincolnensis]|uniref:hypothetical protein n=1 Tax=Streptomyces lincolnensis TaxID=1915 RepID=UPI001E2CC688|nr:hypothetical protein [Streptomyces lincolnensis]MCD7439702.1 hypothetical protein [Streptomyces lincolnensis]
MDGPTAVLGTARGSAAEFQPDHALPREVRQLPLGRGPGDAGEFGGLGRGQGVAKTSGVTSGAGFTGRTVGVTDLGSGTDTLTQFLTAKKGVGFSAIDLATTAGTTAAMGGACPAARVLARTDWVASHQDTVQKAVDALVATMHWINTHSAADIADKLPPSFVSNPLVTKADSITAPTEGITTTTPPAGSNG